MRSDLNHVNSRLRRILLGLCAALAIAAVAAFALVRGSSDDAGGPRTETADGAAPTISYEIPLGTGARIDAGEPVSILPATLTVHVGDVLQIVNDDDRGHVVGPFYIATGQTLTQRFSSVGEFSGACSVHTDGTFLLRVEP